MTVNERAIFFDVYGTPKQYKRPESDGRGGRRRNRDADPWKRQVRVACLEEFRRLDWLLAPRAFRFDEGPKEPWFPPGVPLSMDVVFHLARPRSHRKADGSLSRAGEAKPWPTGTPDVSNLAKEVEDALANWPRTWKQQRGGVPLLYKDDAQVVELLAVKRYAALGVLEHASVLVKPLDGY